MEISITEADVAADVPGAGLMFAAVGVRSHYLVATYLDEPVGQASYWTDGRVWWFDKLYVQERVRSFGVGMALVHAVYAHALQTTDVLYCQITKNGGVMVPGVLRAHLASGTTYKVVADTDEYVYVQVDLRELQDGLGFPRTVSLGVQG